MLITELKSREEILSHAGRKTVAINCKGCKEAYFPEFEAAELCSELLSSGVALAVVRVNYICNPANLELYVQKFMDKIDLADNILIFSCGIGVQTVSERFKGMPVFAACDTYPLPGHQGVTPLEYDCAQCGECYLSSTGGICPITSCAKSLVNGQCGGSKNGKCEVDKDMECGWERIHRRLERLELLSATLPPAGIRNFSAGGNRKECSL